MQGCCSLTKIELLRILPQSQFVILKINLFQKLICLRLLPWYAGTFGWNQIAAQTHTIKAQLCGNLVYLCQQRHCF